MLPITYALTLKSVCGTYTEYIKCISEQEAKTLAEEATKDGKWIATIKANS